MATADSLLTLPASGRKVSTQATRLFLSWPFKEHLLCTRNQTKNSYTTPVLQADLLSHVGLAETIDVSIGTGKTFFDEVSAPAY